MHCDLVGPKHRVLDTATFGAYWNMRGYACGRCTILSVIRKETVHGYASACYH